MSFGFRLLPGCVCRRNPDLKALNCRVWITVRSKDPAFSLQPAWATILVLLVPSGRHTSDPLLCTAPVLIAMAGDNPPPDLLCKAIVDKAMHDPRELLEVKDDYSRCALHYAAMYATSVAVVELLIDSDQNCLLFETKTGSTPLALAKER